MGILEALEDSHARCAKVVGWLSIALARRSFRRVNTLYYVNELRQAADILEKLVSEESPKER